MQVPRTAIAALLAFVAAAEDQVVQAGPAPDLDALEQPEETVEAALPRSPANELVVVPSPGYNPALGAVLTVIGIYAYRPTPATAKPWTAGALAFGSQNRSWGAAAFNRALIDDDRWRISAGAGYIDVRYDYYGIGDSPLQGDPLPLRQRVAVIGGAPLLRVADRLYLGPSLMWRGIRTTCDDVRASGLELSQQLLGLGIDGEYDSRDEQYTPRRGWYLQGRWQENRGTELALGPFAEPGPDYSLAYLRINRYQPLTAQTVAALRASTQFASADTPFYDLPSLGGRGKDMRGYTGEYRDRVMAAVQAEIRQELFWRLGLVAFGGAAALAPSYAALMDADIHPCAGGGLRFLVATENRINMALDAAWGDLGWTWYLTAGEAF